MTSSLKICGAVQKILSKPAPVLFLDTCAILDVIRAPVRENIKSGVLTASHDLIKKSTKDPPGLWIVITSVVYSEWQKHSTRISQETEKAIKKINRQIVHLHPYARLAGLVKAYVPLRYESSKLSNILKDISQDFIDNSVIVGDDSECLLRAGTRVISNTPPASEGSQEFKDCAIIEHYLTLCRELNKEGFSRKKVFVSSNTKDFCRGGRRLHPDLDKDFQDVRLDFALDLAWANATLA